MEYDFWHQRWDEDDIGFHPTDVNPLLESHWPGMSREPANVLVPLCGKSLDMMWLRRRGHRVQGVEMSPVAADAFFSEHDIEPFRAEAAWGSRLAADGLSVLVADFFELMRNDLDAVDAVYDRAALVALPPAMRLRYAHKLASLTASRTPIFAILFDYDDPGLIGPPFSVPEDEVAALFPEYHLSKLAEHEVLIRNVRVREYAIVLEPADAPDDMRVTT